MGFNRNSHHKQLCFAIFDQNSSAWRISDRKSFIQEWAIYQLLWKKRLSWIFLLVHAWFKRDVHHNMSEFKCGGLNRIQHWLYYKASVLIELWAFDEKSTISAHKKIKGISRHISYIWEYRSKQLVSLLDSNTHQFSSRSIDFSICALSKQETHVKQ